ncbi:MAG: hypothetical protein R3277_03075 [Brumimicrobium sp.]|nr:hypothetical protein [Brumimicrobium sp.]
MSKEQEHIDQLFKNKLSDRKFDGPPADFLADLNSRLDERAAGRGFLWYFRFFFDLALLLTILLSLFYLENNPLGKTVQHAEIKTYSKENEKVNEHSADEHPDTLSVRNQTDRLTQMPSENKPSVSASDRAKKESPDARTKSNPGIKTTIRSAGEENRTDHSGVKNKPEGKTSRVQAKNNVEKAKNSNSLQEPEKLQPMLYLAIFPNEFDLIRRKIQTGDFPKMPVSLTSFPEKTKEIVSEPLKKNKSIELQLYGGPVKWNYNTLGTNDSYIAKLSEESSAKWSPNLGIALNMNLGKYSYGTGISYTSYREENFFEFTEVNSYDSTYIISTDTTVTYDSINNQWDTIVTNNYDSTTVTDTIQTTNPVTNQYHWIQIPLNFGYRFNLNKWAIIPRVGLNIGLGISKNTGFYPDENYDVLQEVVPLRWNLNLHTSLEIRRSFGSWHAFGRFDYQRNLTPTIDAVIFERKYQGIGLNFGVGYSFR